MVNFVNTCNRFQLNNKQLHHVQLHNLPQDRTVNHAKIQIHVKMEVNV